MQAGRAQLGAGFFWYYAALGLLVPFLPVYLSDRGFGPADIGALMGVYAGLRIIGPPLFARWADAPGRRVLALQLASVASLLCVLTFHWLGSFAAIAVALAIFSALWNGLMPVFDAQVLDQVDADAGRYGALRLWGSLGFIATALGAGIALEGEGMSRFPWLLAACVGVTCVVLASLKRPAQVTPGRRGPILPSLRQGRVIALLAVSFLMLLSHGAYYGFFSLYLEQHGYSRGVIGLLWALGVAAEIAVFLMAARLTLRFSLRFLLLVSLAATSLRWGALAMWPEWPLVVVLAQLLHLASFGLFHLCLVTLTRQLFPLDAAASAQALQGSISYGAGGMLGVMASGSLWQAFGPSAPFVFSAAVAAIAWLVALLGLGVLGAAPRPSGGQRGLPGAGTS